MDMFIVESSLSHDVAATKKRGCSNISPLSYTQEKLRQAVQGCKLLKLKCNLAEIASVSGIAKRTAQHHKEAIQGYWSEDSIFPDKDKDFIRERIIELGIQNVLKSKEPNIEEIFGIILGIYLKAETSLLDKTESLKEIRTIGRHIARVYKRVCDYKESKGGVPVHSDYQPAKYFLHQKNIAKKNLDKLFVRSRDYVSGKYSI